MPTTSPLVVVFLRGGADGLSLVIPIDDPQYLAARPTLRVTNKTTPLDAGFGLHPAAQQLAAAWKRKELAAVPACAIAGQSRSHFEAQFLAEAAVAPGVSAHSGWLGRYLAIGANRTPQPLRGLCLGGVGLPVSLLGTNDAIATPTLGALRLGLRRAPALPRAALDSLWDTASTAHPLAKGAIGALAALDTAKDLAAPAGDARAAGDGEIAAALGQAATALAADAGVEVVMVNSGHWDDHTNLGAQDGAFAKRVADLDTGISLLHAAVPGATVLVMTEFGRRLQENSSGGADHGRGGVSLLVGPRVRGGIHGDWPGLRDLDEGDVRAVNDQRAVLHSVVGDLLKADPTAVLPEYKPAAPLRLIAS